MILPGIQTNGLDVLINLTALRKAKIVNNFGFSECNRVNTGTTYMYMNKNCLSKECILLEVFVLSEYLS